MLTPGEAVVPKHLVSAIAPFLSANKVPGFAAGGMVAPMLPPAPDLTGLALIQARIAALTAGHTAEDKTVLPWASSQLAALQGMQATGSASLAPLASLLLPGMSIDDLAAGIPGIGIGAYGGLTPPGISGVAASTPSANALLPSDQVMHNHISVTLDGQQIYRAVQQQTLRQNIRNNGIATGLMKPK
jgi:hypothetical protein